VTRSVYVGLVRHAPTAWTAEGRIQGRADPPLSPEGRARAAQWRLPADLARLAAEGRLGWAASPLRRAVETAALLGGTAPRLDPRLAERDFGVWTGRLLAEAAEAGPEAGWAARPPAGESLAEVLARARAWLDDLGTAEGPETWVAVTHGGVIRALVAAATGWDLRPPAPLRLLPERLHRLRRRGDGHLQLVTLNEPLLPP
jgi:probable phosphoglycerate mutase